MTTVDPATPDTAYLTKSNIVHPQSNRGAAGDIFVTEAEARARAEMATRNGGTTVTGGSIRKGR